MRSDPAYVCQRTRKGQESTVARIGRKDYRPRRKKWTSEGSQDSNLPVTLSCVGCRPPEWWLTWVGDLPEFPLRFTDRGARYEFKTPSPLALAAAVPRHLSHALGNHDPVVVRIDDGGTGTDGANRING
jgi:hypothetical protein